MARHAKPSRRVEVKAEKDDEHMQQRKGVVHVGQGFFEFRIKKVIVSFFFFVQVCFESVRLCALFRGRGITNEVDDSEKKTMLVASSKL